MSFRYSVLRSVLLCATAASAMLPLAVAQTQNVSSLQNQAKEGNAEAQYELAKDYYTGTGVPKDSKQGLQWLKKSAEQGHPGAEFALAVLYRKGELNDPRIGLQWLQKSAEHGNAAAEYQLGCLFRDGEGGVSRNPHEAAVWLRKAARQQSEPAGGALALMLKTGAISRQEANWKAPEPITKPREPVVQTKTETPKPFSLGELEKGLQGGITCKRMATLVDKFKVDFSLNDNIRQRLSTEGADDNLLAAISASKRPL